MSAIITNKFRIIQADQFISSIDAGTDTYYVGIGKHTPWSISDASPETPTDSFSQMIQDYNDMFGVKRVISGNAIHSVQAHKWTINTAYSMFDDQDTSLYTTQFYVITDEYNVYKCIHNGFNTANPTGRLSTIKPTGTSPSMNAVSADGYVWKYMMTVSATTKNKFPSNNWIPVSVLSADDGSLQYQVQANAVAGAVHVIKVINGGTGYVTAPVVSITGDGVNCAATAVITGGVVTEIVVNNIGTGYTNASVSIAAGPGTQATARAIISPLGGHGKNIVEELGATYVSVSVTLEADETGLLPVTNDYRKIVMIKSPLLYGTSTKATATVIDTTKSLTFTTVSGSFIEDELITQASTGATGRVVDFDLVNKKIRYVTYSGTFNTINNVVGSVSSVTGAGPIVVNEGVLAPESGVLFYKDYRLPINRAIDQSESISIVLSF